MLSAFHPIATAKAEVAATWSVLRMKDSSERRRSWARTGWCRRAWTNSEQGAAHKVSRKYPPFGLWHLADLEELPQMFVFGAKADANIHSGEDECSNSGFDQSVIGEQEIANEHCYKNQERG